MQQKWIDREGDARRNSALRRHLSGGDFTTADAGAARPPSAAVTPAVTHRSYALTSSPAVDARPAPPEVEGAALHWHRRPPHGAERAMVATSRGIAHAPAVWLLEEGGADVGRAAGSRAGGASAPVELKDGLRYVDSSVEETAAARILGETAMEDEGADEDEVQRRQDSERRGRRERTRAQQQQLAPSPQQPWVVAADALDVVAAGQIASATTAATAKSEAPSPRVLHHRLAPYNDFRVPSNHSDIQPSRDYSREGSRRSASPPSPHSLERERRLAGTTRGGMGLVSAPPEEVTEDQRSASSESYAGSSTTDTRTQTWISATRAVDGSPAPSQQRRSAMPLPAAAAPVPVRRPPVPLATAAAAAAAATARATASVATTVNAAAADRRSSSVSSRHRHRDHHRHPRSHHQQRHRSQTPKRRTSSPDSIENDSSRSSSSSSTLTSASHSTSSSSSSARPSSRRRSSRGEAAYPAAAARSKSKASPTPAPSCTNCVVDGFGPLMVVHLDVLPELRSLCRGTAATSGAGEQPQPQHPQQQQQQEQTLQCHSAGRSGGEGVLGGLSPRSSALVLHAGVQDGASHHLIASPGSNLKYHDSDEVSDAAEALHALIVHEAHASHTNEVAALYAKLEVAEQRARIAEQQVAATAEVRAAELVRDYKADERRRRAQFQTSLDALREENRTLTAQLEAAARAPAMGLHPSTAATTAVVSLLPGTGQATSPLATTTTATTTTGTAGNAAGNAAEAAARAAGVLTAQPSPAEVARQVHAVEAYWRDRLRTAERHWEDEMTRQGRQRREALDQVDELVRTVEQTQEELRYTRRQAARLREENARLTAAVGNVSTTSTTTTTATALHKAASTAAAADEVARLRRVVAAHEHREAALLAQVESYGEEATQLRLRYEAAVERAAQDLAAERRRSTEMVKLYGSQLESLHHQLREAKRSASLP